MTLLCFRRMGCGQSIRKKSKHKSDTGADDKCYKNESFVATSGAKSVDSKYSGIVATNSTTSTNDFSEVMPKAQTPASLSSPGSHSSSADQSEQVNGDTRLGQATDKDKVVTRRDSGMVRSCLQSNSQLRQSQVEFFRLLDEKIAQGKDYDPDAGS